MSPRGAVHNALSRGTLASALSRAVGDSEGTGGLERYGETLTPTLNLWALPEWAYLRHERIAAAQATAGAVAGESGVVSLLNPVGSGNLVVVESVMCMAQSSAFHHLSFPIDSTAVIGAAQTGINNVDNRWGALNRPASLIYAGTSAAPPGGAALLVDVLSLANDTQEMVRDRGFVLIPGTVLVAWCETVNLGVKYSFRFRERKAFPGELE